MTQQTPRRGEIWRLGGTEPRDVIVISGNMFNELPDHPFVLAMDVHPGEATDSLLTAQLPAGMQFAEVDTIGQIPKALLLMRVRGPVDVQTVTDIHNRLFKILATS